MSLSQHEVGDNGKVSKHRAASADVVRDAPAETISVVEKQVAVAVAGDGRHVFDAVQDPRVRLPSPAETPQPDLIAFQCSRFRRFDNLTGLTLTESTLAHIARGRAGLVFDVSLEGVPHNPDVSAALQAVMGWLGATPRQCVYVKQDRQYEADYRCGLTTFPTSYRRQNNAAFVDRILDAVHVLHRC